MALSSFYQTKLELRFAHGWILFPWGEIDNLMPRFVIKNEQTIPLFVFDRRRKRGLIPFVRLVYCRDVEDFVRFAGPLGRFLARRGFLFVVLDANEPVGGLVGRYYEGFPKYFKGPDQPRLGDWAYTTRIMFDL